MALTRRAHILFDSDSYEWLKERAKRTGTSVGDVVRTAISHERFGDISQRAAAGKAILNATPMSVDDWEVMEQELEETIYGEG